MKVRQLESDIVDFTKLSPNFLQKKGIDINIKAIRKINSKDLDEQKKILIESFQRRDDNFSDPYLFCLVGVAIYNKILNEEDDD